jgi:hypothetical protein
MVGGPHGREQEAVYAKVLLLRKVGPTLPRPHADTVNESKHPNMKELRVQCGGDPYRVLFAFDPRRTAILLIGGEKTRDEARFYRTIIPEADRLYDEHLETLKREGLI